MNTGSFKRTKFTCFFTYLAMSSVFSLPPLLFGTFHEVYGISYTLLGTLVLINFITQWTIDLIFTFFARYFNIRITVRIMPLLTTAGLTIYGVLPTLMPDHAFLWLVVGTVVFSAASGLCEVLLSPIVAALPSDDPGRDMSLLHSLYAWGVLGVVLLTSAFLAAFGAENRIFLILFFAALPIVSFVLFCVSPIPDIDLKPDEQSSADKSKKTRARIGIALFALCIFIGSAAENAMTNWISVFAESALGIPKTVGDLLGLALFAALLGIGRTIYAKFGKNISAVLLVSMAGAACCYITAGLSPNVVVSMIACTLTGLCTSMLWPGTLIMMEESFPHPGVAAYALMAAGGDLGGSVAPQLLGAVVDTVSESSTAASLAENLSLTTEQIGMKAGMLSAAALPLVGVILLVFIRKFIKKSA